MTFKPRGVEVAVEPRRERSMAIRSLMPSTSTTVHAQIVAAAR